MATEVKIISNTIPNGSYRDFTSSGFGTPDAAILIIGSAHTSANPFSSVQGISFGFYDGTNQYSWGIAGGTRYSSSTLIGQPRGVSYTASSEPTDGIRITPGTTSVDRYATVILIKGLSNVAIGSFTAQNGGTVSGLGFEPNFLILGGIGAGISGGIGSGSHGINSIGVARQDSASSITQAVHLHHVGNEDSALFDDEINGQLYFGSVTWSEPVASFDTGGFTLGDGSGSGGIAIYLALEFPDADDTYIDIIETKGSTGADTAVTGVGFEPQALMFVGTDLTTQDGTIDTTSFGLSYGADDGTNAVAYTHASEPGGGVDESEYVSDSSLYVAVGGTPTQEGHVSAFGSDGYTMTYDTSGAAVKAIVFGFGDSTGGEPPVGITSPILSSYGIHSSVFGGQVITG